MYFLYVKQRVLIFWGCLLYLLVVSREGEAQHEALELLRQGNKSLSNKVYHLAISYYEQALRLDSTLALAHHNLGIAKLNLFIQKGNTEQIPLLLPHFNKAIFYDKLKPDAYFSRANLYLIIKDYPKALADIDQAIKLKPDFAAAYKLRGKIYFEQENLSKACTDWDKAIKLGYITLYKEVALHCDGVEREIARRQEGITHEAYLRMGKEKMEKKQYEEAIRDFTFAIEIDMRFAEAFFFRGKAKYALELKQAACLDWQKALIFGYAEAQRILNDYCIE